MRNKAMVCINQESAYRPVAEGIDRKVLSAGGGMMCVQMHFQKGAVGALHRHPHEQIGYVVSGRFELTMAGETTAIGSGDTYYVAPDVEHGVLALEESLLVDVFTPQRQDFYS